MRWANPVGFGARIALRSGAFEPVERFLIPTPDNSCRGHLRLPQPRGARPWGPVQRAPSMGSESGSMVSLTGSV
jgi:hypothetical protein